MEINDEKVCGREFSHVFKLLKQTKNTTTTDFINQYHKKPQVWSNKLAYLAGLIDGEGYLKIEKHGTIRLVIGMTHKETIEWIHNNFGGNITEQKTELGKSFYVWRMNQGKDLFYLLLLVIPFMVTKKETVVNAMKQLIDKFSKLEHTLKNYTWPDMNNRR
jgi:hypothetical protein